MILRKWFSPPTFADEEKTHTGSILNVALWFSIFVLVIILFLRLSAKQPNILIVSIVLAMIFCMGFALFIMHRGHVWVAALLLITPAWFSLTYLAWSANGVQDTAFIAHIPLILAASLLLGWRAGAIFTGLSIAAGWLLAYMEVSGQIVPGQQRAYDIALDMTFVFAESLLFIHLTISSLSRALVNAKQSNRQLVALSSDLENQVSERTRKAEQAQHDAEIARQAMETQVWLTAGQAQLSEIMWGEQNVTTLTGNVLRTLCRYLNVPVGAFFVKQSGHLELRGTYAYVPSSHYPTRFKLGEGLVGEAARKKRPLTIDTIPENYPAITSSLGEQRPSHLLLQPILYEDNVLGVIEMGNWDAFSPEQWHFLQAIVEGVGVALHTARTRARVNELLQETQQQAAELQVQEEELRAANEALAVQTANLTPTLNLPHNEIEGME